MNKHRMPRSERAARFVERVGRNRAELEDAYEEAVERAGEAQGWAQDRLRHVADDAGRYYRRGNAAVAERIGNNTIATLLVAGIIGYLAAWIVYSRPWHHR
jgi:hypothetical protein